MYNRLMESYDILVIMLSVALFMFIALGVWALVLLVQVLKKVKTTTETARHAAEKVEEFTANLKSAGKLTALGTTITQIVKIFNKGGKK